MVLLTVISIGLPNEPELGKWRWAEDTLQPTEDKQYGLWINDELAVSCYYLKRKAEGVNLINEVIELQEHKYRKKHYIKSLEYFNQL